MQKCMHVYVHVHRYAKGLNIYIYTQYIVTLGSHIQPCIPPGTYIHAVS